MSTIATVAEVLDAVETDFPDSVLQRMLDAAEEDVRDHLTSTEQAKLPVVIWTGRYRPALNAADGSLTIPTSILACPIVRFEGTVAHNGATPAYTADTEELDEDGGSDTLTPILADDTEVAAGAYTVTIDDTGKVLTVDTTGTTAAVTITRILGLQQANPPARWVSATIDLVELAVRYRGVKMERVGQYDVTLADYHQERGRVLGRLVYASDKSLAF